MKLIDKYIGRTVLEFILISVIALVGIEIIFALADEAGDIGEGRYTFSKALQYVVLTMPRKLYEHFPVIVLLGGLLGMGQLAAHNELIAMQASALSISRILKGVLQVIGICMLVVIFIGEWLAPRSEQYAQNLRASAKHSGFKAAWDEGAWVRHGNWFIYIQDIISSTELRNITAYEVNEAFQLQSIQKVESAKHREDGWYLSGVTGNHFEKNHVEVKKQDSLMIKEWIKPDVLEALVVKPSTMSTVTLWHYIRYLKENQLESDKFRLAFWSKLVQPLATGVMLFLTIPFVFGPLRRTTLGRKIVMGGFIGFVFLLSNQLLGHISLIFHLPPVIAALLPTSLFFAAGLVLMKRVRRMG